MRGQGLVGVQRARVPGDGGVRDLGHGARGQAALALGRGHGSDVAERRRRGGLGLLLLLDLRDQDRAQEGDALRLDGCGDRVSIALGICAVTKRPFPNTQTARKWRVLTRIARLADLSPPPVQVVALPANPVTGLVFDGSAVAGIEDRGVLDAMSEMSKTTCGP